MSEEMKSLSEQVIVLIRSEPYKTASYYANILDVRQNNLCEALYLLHTAGVVKRQKFYRADYKKKIGTKQRKIVFHYWLPEQPEMVEPKIEKKKNTAKKVSFFRALCLLIGGRNLYSTEV